MTTTSFLHLSDFHFRADGGASLGRRGVNYDPAQILDHFLANTDFSQYEFVAITGDLTNDGDAADFEALRRLLDGRIPIPYYVTLGNHDDKKAFRAGFLGEQNASSDPYYQVVDHKGLRLVFLDTGVDFQHGGHLDQPQIDWYAEVTAQPAPQGTLQFQHHPFLVSWKLGLEKFVPPADFVQLLEDSDVRAIFTGHLHLNHNAVVYGRMQHTCSSMAIGLHRFGEIVVDTNQLGYSYCDVTEEMVDVCHQEFHPQYEVFGPSDMWDKYEQALADPNWRQTYKIWELA